MQRVIFYDNIHSKGGIVLNERIKKIRTALNLNQTDFGKKIGVKQTTIAGYESGARQPLDTVIASICREFNVNEEWLRTGAGGEENMFNKISPISQTYNHFGYIMENATSQKKAVLTALIEMAYSIDDEKWNYICDQFQKCLEEGKKGKV